MDEFLKIFLSGGVAVALINTAEKLISLIISRRAVKKGKMSKHLSEFEERTSCDIENLRIGMRAILHDRIKYLCKCHITAGTIGYDNRQDLIDMHTVYHNQLRGNGNLDSFMNEITSLANKEKGGNGK